MSFGLQLNPPIPFRIPPDVDAYAIVMIDRGPGTHLEWVCHVPSGPNAGGLFTLTNPEVRVNTSITEGWDELRPFTAEEMERWAFLLPPETDDACKA